MLLPPEAFPFCGPSYVGSDINFAGALSPRVDAQESINLYPEPELPSSKGQIALVGTPGLSAFRTGLRSPIRQLWPGSGLMFCVDGAGVHEVLSGLTDYGLMPGSSGGSVPCYFAQGPGPAFTLLVCDPNVGKVYNVVNPIGASVFDGIALTYLDGFFISIAKPVAGTTQNQLNCSIAGGGGVSADWPALNFARRTSANDKVNQLATVHRQLWVFGEKTIELWYNAGNIGFPFAPIPGSLISTGTNSPYSVVALPETIMWLGADNWGQNVVYRTRGLLPERVSNSAVESYLNRNWDLTSQAVAFAYSEQGHAFYVLNIPDVPAAGRPGLTLSYDLSTNMWHRRATLSAGALKVALPYCAASTTQTSTGQTWVYVGDRAVGTIYQQSLQFVSENGAVIRRQRTAPHVSNQNRWMKHSRLEIDADIGTAQIALSLSNDGGKTFPRSYVAQSASTDLAQDGFGRFYWLQLGRSRDRVYRAIIDDSANQITLVGGYLTVNPGNEA